MKLDVLEAPTPWYGDGLKFTCTQCGNCCTGPPGFVWISSEEIAALAAQLQLTVEQTIEQYCRPIGDKFALREVRNTRGEYDCVFLQDHGGGRRTCGVYQSRPTQCRTWPFWPGNLASREAWDAAAVRCHGMNQGRQYSLEEITAQKDAQDRDRTIPDSAAKSSDSAEGAAKSAALEPMLTELLARWNDLPPVIRSAILAIAREHPSNG